MKKKIFNRQKQNIARGRQWPGTGPVGRHAQAGSPNRKRAARLDLRRKDYANFMAAKNPAGGTQQRKDSGGFHRPGSIQ